MSSYSLREMVQTRKAKLGHFIVEFATPGIGHIVKAAGCDFVLFDLEHSGFGFETVKSAIRYFEAADVAPIVRVPSKDYQHIARACDMGAEGIMIPMVANAREAKSVVDCMKYFPLGKRGVALGVAHDRYRGGGVTEKLAAANQTTTLFCQIETEEGVANADAIAGTEGVDCLWVGHFDLSVSLGIPGEFDNPKFLSAIDAVVKAARKHNKALGRLHPNVATAIDYHKKGFDFCCYSGDVWVLRDALAEAIGKLRQELK